MVIRLAHGNDVDGCIRFHVDNQDHQLTEQADTDHALFAVVCSLILEQHHRAGEDFLRIGEIQPMLGEIDAALGFGPGESNAALYIR